MNAPRQRKNDLDRAETCDGLSLIHIPVYFCSNGLRGLGKFGSWNAGNWRADTQALRHGIEL